MILDKQNLFTASTGQSITGSAASTNVLDMGAHGDGVPDPSVRAADAYIQAIVTANFNTLDTLAIAFQSDSTEDFSSGAVVTHDTNTVALADLLIGKTVTFRPGVGTGRYWRLYFTVSGSNPSTGKIVAGLTHDDPTNR